ncbi:MAG: hypothetical protein ABFC34_05385 [Methanobacterium sp.]
MNDDLNVKKALELFERQIECIMSDDRIVQMELYAEDLRYDLYSAGRHKEFEYFS